MSASKKLAYALWTAMCERGHYLSEEASEARGAIEVEARKEGRELGLAQGLSRIADNNAVERAGYLNGMQEVVKKLEELSAQVRQSILTRKLYFELPVTTKVRVVGEVNK